MQLGVPINNNAPKRMGLVNHDWSPERRRLFCILWENRSSISTSFEIDQMATPLHVLILCWCNGDSIA